MAEIVIHRQLPCPPERVYRAFTDPDALAGWLCERASGEAIVGGKLRLHWPSLGQTIDLIVKEARAPHALCLEVEIDGFVHSQTVELEGNDQSTSMCLRQTVPSAIAHGTESGWLLRLHLLERFLRCGGERRISTVATACVGSTKAVFDTLRLAVTSMLPATELSLPPHAISGPLSDSVLYAFRVFPLLGGQHLVAGQLMTWDDKVDLFQFRPRLQGVAELLAPAQRPRYYH